MKKLLSMAAILAVSATSYVAQAQMTNEDLQAGDTVEFEGKKWLVGPNIVTNPSFNDVTEDGKVTGWTVGGGNAPSTQADYDALAEDCSYKQMYLSSGFTAYTEGGFDGGAYIRSNGSGTADATSSIVQRWSIDPGYKYYFTFWMRGQGANNQYVPCVSITPEKSKCGGMNELIGTDTKGKLHNGTTLLGKNGDDPSETSFGYSNYVDNDTWAQTSIFFNSEECTYLQFNSRWMPSTTCLDGFYLAKLYDIETTSKLDILKIQMHAALENALIYAETLNDYPGLQNPLYDLEMFYGDDSMIETEEDALNATAEINRVVEEVENGVIAAEELKTVLAKVERLLGSDNLYEGAEALSDSYSAVSDNMDADTWTTTEYVNAVESLNKAITDYYYSQSYSEDNPADYTFLITAPHFCTEEAEPTVVDGVFSYPNVANYADGSAPSDAVSTNWYKGAYTSGDQRLNYKESRICWNAWATSFDELSINQDIAEIPNGYYSVSADLITQNGCVTDQRVYAKSSLSEAESVSLNAENIVWVDSEPYNGTWETLSTGKIMVSDGKLTIGAKGTGDKEHLPTEFGGTNNDYRRGWFCVTNFKLHYYGPLSEEDTKAAFEKKIAEMQAQCDTMTFKADKAAYQDSINKYKTASSLDEMNEALAALAVAQTTAAASISKQVSVKSGITAALTDSIDNGVYEGDYLTMATKFRDCMLAEINAEDATYTEMDSIVQILYSFRDSYVPTLVEARALVVTDSEAKAVLDKNINDQVADFTTMEALPLQTKVEKYVADLETAIAECEAFNLFQSGTKDYTSMIVNADIEDSSSSSATGWTISYVNGNTHTGSNQQVDGNTSGRYLDSYNNTPGKLLYNAYQTIKYVPNGTYKLEAMTRTAGDTGAYLYAMADEDSTTTKLSLIELEEMNFTELFGDKAADGGDSIATVSDSYGSIWAELYKRTNDGADADGAQGDTLNANNGKGYGWHYTSLEIEVKNHVLTIGVTTDSVFTMKYGGEPFTGTWFSADNFTLKMIAEGDNSGWNPTTGITVPGEAVENELEIKVVDGTIVSNGEIYSLSGVRVASGSKVPAGVYIVRLGDQSKKVLVK